MSQLTPTNNRTWRKVDGGVELMTGNNPLGITGLLGLHFYVRDLERSRKFYTEVLDFAEVGASTPETTEQGRQQSLIFRAGYIHIVCSSPVGDGGRAHRYLSRHPDGIGTVTFEVRDISGCFEQLEKRGATAITDIQIAELDDGRYQQFSITTPFGDTTFRFVQRSSKVLFPGMEYYAEPRGGANRHGFARIDHITSNFQTMSPALLWMEHVMGFEHIWEIQFHTSDLSDENGSGSGLSSKVMGLPDLGIKFANNEPRRPNFKESQINLFTEQHRGPGVQHVALTVPDIMSTVDALMTVGAPFMPIPDSYYDMLPERLKRIGVGSIDEDIEALRKRGILVDGAAKGFYLLQIFLADAAQSYGDTTAGPFFYEIIMRKGDEGFGAGNFRALFESIERQQQIDGGSD